LFNVGSHVRFFNWADDSKQKQNRRAGGRVAVEPAQAVGAGTKELNRNILTENVSLNTHQY